MRCRKNIHSVANIVYRIPIICRGLGFFMGQGDDLQKKHPVCLSGLNSYLY